MVSPHASEEIAIGRGRAAASRASVTAGQADGADRRRRAVPGRGGGDDLQCRAMNVPEFQAKWQGSALKERSAAHEHFLDLCRLLGMPTPAEADKTGAFSTF